MAENQGFCLSLKFAKVNRNRNLFSFALTHYKITRLMFIRIGFREKTGKLIFPGGFVAPLGWYLRAAFSGSLGEIPSGGNDALGMVAEETKVCSIWDFTEAG